MMGRRFSLRFTGLILAGVTTMLLGVVILPHQAQAQSPGDRAHQLEGDGACGTISTDSPHDYAGLIVVLGALPYGGSPKAINEGQRSDGARVNVSTYGGTLSPPGNVVKLGAGPEGVSDREHDHTFGSRDIQGAHASCTGQLILPGYGDGSWAIDCDVSKRGAGNEQKIQAQGQGTPYLGGKKLRAGGTWTKSEIVQPKNGKHAVAITTYHEPAAPSEGYNIKPVSTVNHPEVQFNYEYPAHVDVPTVDKPDGYYQGEPCSDYDGHPGNKDHCQTWNKYWRDVAQADQDAADHNRQAARQALNTVQFHHKVGNVGSNGKVDWVQATGVTSSIYKKVIPNNSGPTPARAHVDGEDWTVRFGDWTTNLAKNVWKNHRDSPDGVPTDDSYLNSMIDSPRQGDKYCEQIRVNPNSSTDGSVESSDPACVKLSPNTVDECDAWQLNGSTYIDGPRDPASAWVGDTFTSHYTYWKTGPADHTAVIDFKHNGGGAGNLWIGDTSWNPSYNTGPFTPQDGGKTFDDVMTYNPTHSSGAYNCDSAGSGQQGPNTMYVPWFYQLHPQVDINGDSPQIVQQGTPAKVDPSVILNSNDPARSLNRWNTCADAFDWELRVTAEKPDTPGVKDPLPSYDRNGHKNPRDICPDGSPQLLESGPSVDTTVLPAGTKLCGKLKINPSTEDSGSSDSIEKCTVVVKAPKVQFWNSDVNTGRHFQQADNNPTCGEASASAASADLTTVGPPTSVASDNLYGSWVEYGAFASGGVSSFGSAADNKSGGYSADPTGQRLTFGNDGNLGQFAYSNWCIPDYGKLYEQQRDQSASTLTGSTVDLGGVSANQYYTASVPGNIELKNIGDIGDGKQNITIEAPNANIVLDGGTVKPGVRLVIHAAGTVKIDGDIKYSNSGYANIDDIPRIIVVADGQVIAGGGDQQGIVVNDDVTQIDAWLVTRQGLYTCTTKPSSLTYSGARCGKQLVVNGPVAVDALHLRRTFGADLTKPLDERGPAEVFNLNPDAFLGSYSAAQRDYFTDVYQRDVPPRY